MTRTYPSSLTSNNYCSQPSNELDHGPEEFKRTPAMSFEDFKNRYSNREWYKDQPEDVWKRAYEWHCRIEQTDYEIWKEGGNPARML